MFGKTAARCALGAAIVLIAPAAALAHPGFAPHSGLVAGFLHPLTGVDHLLAMIAVGIFAAHVGRRGLWSLPLGFLMLLAVGGALGAAGVRLPFVEMMIALSVVALGLAVAIPKQWPVAAATLLVGAFALFHGHVHGVELPTGVPAVPYAGGGHAGNDAPAVGRDRARNGATAPRLDPDTRHEPMDWAWHRGSRHRLGRGSGLTLSIDQSL